MARRKEEKEALRRQREEREAKARAEQQRKRLVGFGAAGVLVLAAVVIGFLLVGGGGNGGGPGGEGDFFPEGGDAPTQKVFDLDEAVSAAGCELKSSKGSGVATHTTSLDEKIKYKTNPPTTGRHYEIPAEDGVYGGAPPPDEALGARARARPRDHLGQAERVGGRARRDPGHVRRGRGLPDPARGA